MKNQLHKSITEIWKDEYVVPLYQRNFAWMEEQIRQLLQDIYDHHTDSGNYYLGSLVVLQRNDGRLEVIDGQQRLTALQIICKELNIATRPCLHYDSRPEVESFFNTLYSSATCMECQKFYQSKDNPKINRLVDALGFVSETKIRNFEGKEQSFGEFSQQTRNAISNYLRNKVILIRVPLPSDTDVAAYFEIMNNRGKQLQPHEIIKALIMGDKRLSPNHRSIFAAIWDACSQMDIPVQRSLALFRKDNKVGPLFGEHCNTLNIQNLSKYQVENTEKRQEP